jgi:hypothetical protein
MLTNQEIFERVYAHAMKQGKQALGEDGRSCMYRAPDGSRCFAGCLIADRHYDPAFERDATYCPRVRDALISSGVPMRQIETLKLVYDLQAAHDRPFDGDDSISCWRERLTEVAKRHSLDTSKLGSIADA